MQARLETIEAEELGAECFEAERIEIAARQLAGQLQPAGSPSAAHPLESGEISEDWINQTIDIEANQIRLDKRRGVLLTLANTAGSKSRQIRSAAQPRILAAYQRELNRLLDDVRAVSNELGDIDTAAKAIAADAGPLWKQLAELADEYGDLRSAQLGRMPSQTKFETSPEFPGEPHASDLYLRNLDRIWPEWRRGGSDNQRVDLSRTTTASRAEPWPADPSELMLWLVRSNAQPWIPTDADLSKMRQERHARANPTPNIQSASFDKKTKTIKVGA